MRTENNTMSTQCPDECVGCAGAAYPCEECGYCTLQCRCISRLDEENTMTTMASTCHTRPDSTIGRAARENDNE